MAAGLPIVATRVGGVRELIEHQRTGVIVLPDDPRALAYALLDLIQWDAHAAALGQAARSAVRARYSYDRMVAAYEGLFRDELSRHAAVVPVTTEVVAS
jgi:glycosyltransferase involved in cell wall biosynthesis